MELYLDNFRGFEKQYIELNDVNFLVGENSTGKTTLLGLLSLFLETPDIWVTHFKNNYVDFGPYSDIIRKGKRGVKNFEIGVKVDMDSSFPDGEILFKYREENGFPMLYEWSVRNKNIIAAYSYALPKSTISYYNVNQIEGAEWANAHHNKGILLFSEKFPWNNDIMTPPEDIFYSDFYTNPEQRKIVKNFENIFFFEMLRGFDEEIYWIDPVRSKPKRIYEPQRFKYSPEGEHTPTLLRDILMNNTEKHNKVFISALESFGKASGLFDEVKIDQYRKSKDSPFSLLFKLKNKELKISNIGYGISQVLPILTEVLYAPKGSTFLIQQPEVHLHPRSQAYFGEFVFNQLVEQKKKFVIETHSDYLIDRFRLQVRKRNGQVYKKTNILFFETDGQTNKVTQIAIDKNGDYVGEQPQKFREFFLKEEMELLGL
jgi:predicted ATPase